MIQPSFYKILETNGSAKIKKIGLDTNLFIYHFERNPAFTPHADRLFTQVAQGQMQAVTSIISLLETLSYPSPEKVLQQIQAGFYSLSNLKIVEVNLEISVEAAKIRRTYGFRLPDSIQLATAVLNEVDSLITNDSKLTSFKEVPVKALGDLTI